MSEDINHDRRHFLGTFLGTTAMTMGAAQFGVIGSEKAQVSKLPTQGEFSLPSAVRPSGLIRNH